jgi:hypothetical protein
VAPNLTAEVIDGSVYSEIDRIHPVETEGWDRLPQSQKDARQEMIEKNRQRNREAVQEHCRLMRRFLGLSSAECGEGFNR